MVYRYNVDVEHEGGADLGFVYFSDRVLVPNEVIRDAGRDRSYVIVSVADTTSPDPLNPDVLFASARARPVA